VTLSIHQGYATKNATRSAFYGSNPAKHPVANTLADGNIQAVTPARDPEIGMPGPRLLHLDFDEAEFVRVHIYHVVRDTLRARV
jgi:hypothetical protein